MLILIGGYLASSIIGTTYASREQDTPEVIMKINSDGSVTQSGDLFAGKIFFPGVPEDKNVVQSGVMRIENKYGRINLKSLGIQVSLVKFKNKYNEDSVRNSFLDNMKLKIEQGRLLSFDKTLVNYTNLRNLLYKEDDENYHGIMFEDDSEIVINRNDVIDLKYSLYMDAKAGNELEAVTAKVPIIINAHENPVINDDDDDDDNDGNNNSGDNETFIEEPVQIIPSMPAHWAHNCIIALLDHRKIQGYPHDNMTIEDYRNGDVDPIVYVMEAVKPDEPISRAEASALVGAALNLEPKDAFLTGYADPIPKWAKGYIIATSEKNIFKGYPTPIPKTKIFRPNKHITREEMIAVLVRAFEIKLRNEDIEITFEDKEKIAEWAKESVRIGSDNEIIVGYPDNTYKPQNDITRAEAFTIICKLLGYHSEHTKELKIETNTNQ